MAKFRPDCVYYITEHQRLRPYCDKLSKEIRPSNCTDCGWYQKVSDVMAEVDPAITRLLRTRTREELGLEKLTEDDYKGEDGEAIEAARRGK